MAGQHQQDLARAVVERFKTRATEYAQGIAQRMGSPLSAQELSPDQVAQLWNYSPTQDPAGAYQALISQGASPSQALNQVHPYRQKLYTNGAPTLPQQIDKANQLARLAASRSETSQQAEGGQ